MFDVFLNRYLVIDLRKKTFITLSPLVSWHLASYLFSKLLN